MKHVLLSLSFPALLVACSELKVAGGDDAGTAGSSSDWTPTEPAATDGGANAIDGSVTPVGEAGTGSKGWKTYDEAQKALAAKRFPGPLTATGSIGACTANHFVWQEQDGALHSWSAKTQTRTDYAFKSKEYRGLIFPSDDFIVVVADAPKGARQLAVYKTGEPNTFVSNLPYAQGYAAAAGAVIRTDEVFEPVDGGTTGGVKVRRWSASSGSTSDLSQTLPTYERPAALADDQLVIPGSALVPHAVYIVDVAKKTTASVTFDGALAIYRYLPSPDGLVVSYVRNASTWAIRLYRNNQDTPASRYEIGDDVSNRPGLFPDSPEKEHRPLSRIARYGRALLYDALYGVFAYDIATGSLAPVQLGADKTTLGVDILCVIGDHGLLVYRDVSDSLGQTWLVPLADVLRAGP
ncbi:MAG TPA: hypothetical protein VM925_18780 [Labilithrix sp.]|nr:hypothetical protein [Labilithrix sp.]